MQLVAINYGDPAATIRQYIETSKWTFRIVMGGGEKDPGFPVFSHYGVQAFPTNYVLDSTGKVVWHGVGFDEGAIRSALAKLGVK